MPAEKASKQAERRKSARKEVLETFQVFLVIPQAGLRKIYLKDVSLGGLGFYGESTDRFGDGDKIDCFFYINPSLKLPLSLKVAHVTNEGDGIKVGCEFVETSSKSYKAFVSFLNLLDDLAVFLDV